MINNHFKIACRNLVMHKLNSIIYVVGLATGMTVALLNAINPAKGLRLE
jgi:hypothetical protein